ncbi:MAG TPA: pitrilysin family protein [Vicinamibacterales bacterium]
MKVKAILTLGLFGALTALVAGQAALSQPQMQSSWPRDNPPRPLPARPVTFPQYEIRKLANGMQVVLVSQNEQPALSVRMIIRAGAAHDPKNKYGLAMMTATLLDQGAGKRTAEQIAEEIDFVGGVLGTGAGTDLSYVNAVVMKDGYDTALDLMSDVVMRPTFAQEEIDRQRQQALSALKVAADDPESVADRVIDRLIYGFHPYGMPGSGTNETLSGLTREDFVEFHKKYFVPNNALIAVVGDITAADAMAGLEKYFGAWQPAEVGEPAVTDPPDPTRRVIVIDKKDAVQTEIRVGHIAIPRKHNDFEAIDQAVKILGGEGANRLQQVLRSQKQLTYGASADLDTFKWSGAVVAETDTQTANTAEALRLTVDEFARLQRERVNDGELSGAQDYMVGHFPLTIEVPDQIATQVLNQLFYELPVDDLPRYRERILKVTPDEIQRVARWFIRPAQLSVVLVGDADKFVNDLKGVGFGTFERIPIERLDLMSADFLKHPGATRPE